MQSACIFLSFLCSCPSTKDCIWVNGCQANPRTLEMVLLRQLGLMTAQMEDISESHSHFSFK